MIFPPLRSSSSIAINPVASRSDPPSVQDTTRLRALPARSGRPVSRESRTAVLRCEVSTIRIGSVDGYSIGPLTHFPCIICPEEQTMKRAFASLVLAGLVTFPAFAALKPGDAAPDFCARASLDGKEFNFSLKEALKKGPVIVYFYPSAFTGGCNLQAKTFSDNREKFDAAGASIIGVSQDSIERLNSFSADKEYC